MIAASGFYISPWAWVALGGTAFVSLCVFALVVYAGWRAVKKYFADAPREENDGD